jgi:hypothetical protein
MLGLTAAALLLATAPGKPDLPVELTLTADKPTR